MNSKSVKSSSLMKEDLRIERITKIDVKLFVTNMCPQCAIAIDRIDKIVKDDDRINVEIIDVTKGSIGAHQYERLTDTPYYLVQELFVVPGTSSEDYIRNVLATVGEKVKTNS